MKKGFYIILCIFMYLLLPGCWSRKEPKTLAIVDSVIYDIKDGGGYEITTEVMNPSAQGSIIRGGGSGKSPNITIISKGESVPEAIRNASQSLEKTIFGGNNKVRFFSERFAKKDMVSIMDFLLRDHLVDENPLIVIIKGDEPGRVYNSMLGLSDTVGDYIENLSKTQPNSISKSIFVKTFDFIKDYYDDGKEPTAGVVELVECESKTSNNSNIESQNSQDSSGKKYEIKYGGLAAFKEGKLVGYMDEMETRAYNYITNNIKTSVVSIPVEDGIIVVLIKDPKTKIKSSIENNQITFDVNIKIVMTIIQAASDIDIRKIESLRAIEDSFNLQAQNEISASIEKAQTEFQSDIFGFGKAVHIQHPKKWRELKESWNNHFAKASVNVTVESSVNRSGEIKQPFRMEE